MRVISMLTTGVAGLLLVTAVPAWGAGPGTPIRPSKPRLESRDLAAQANQLPVGGKFDLTGVVRTDSQGTATLELERFEVFASDATITVHGPRGERILPAPATRFFRGTLAGEPASRVFLSVPADGAVRGVVTGRGGAWLIGKPAGLTKTASAELEMRPAAGAAVAASGFSCSTDLLPPPEPDLLSSLAEAVQTAQPSPPPSLGSAAAPVASFTARVAVETDYEFYQIFGNTTDAANYVAGLVGFASIVYSEEISTSLVLQSLSLWTTSSDPWTQNSPLCALFEFGRHWNNNNTSVPRTIAHFLSGKNNGGGVAWIGVLCLGAFSTDASSCPGLTPAFSNYGGAYGYTGSIFGSFDPDNPNLVWDIYAFAHEVGHNFNSPHTHCYGGIGGNANPVDTCNGGQCGGSGCHCGANSLPGPAGSGSGTIMSYCHLLSGGNSNITFTFGTGHPFGVAPERVPSRMSAHVTSTAFSNASCLALVAPSLLNDGFESGNTSSWN